MCCKMVSGKDRLSVSSGCGHLGIGGNISGAATMIHMWTRVQITCMHTHRDYTHWHDLQLHLDERDGVYKNRSTQLLGPALLGEGEIGSNINFRRLCVTEEPVPCIYI